MSLADRFIDRPIFATVLSVLIVIVGFISLQRLPINEYPQVVPPSIQIMARYPGASPVTIADTVAGPIEQQMTGITGMLYQSSQSTADGGMTLTLTFALGTKLEDALVEVHSEDELKIAMAARAPILGINNRDLRSLEIDLNNVPFLTEIARFHGYNGVIVAESGYSSAEHIRGLRGLTDAVLIGSSLMEQEDLETAVRTLLA